MRLQCVIMRNILGDLAVRTKQRASKQATCKPVCTCLIDLLVTAARDLVGDGEQTTGSVEEWSETEGKDSILRPFWLS